MKEVVFITGATAGLGKQCAVFLSKNGYKVYGSGRSVESGDILENFTLVRCDATSDASVNAAIDFIIKQEGQIDVLINNAGRGMLGAAEDATIEESKALFDLNFHGSQRTCNAVLPHMRKRKYGKIINISSLAGLIGLPYRSLYCASKFAIEGWSESMRMELKQFDIYLSVVSPGDFKSNISAGRIVSEKSSKSVYKDQFRRIEKKIDQDVDTGADPTLIIKTIYKIVKSKRPKLRYVAASPFQKFAVQLRKTLPSSWFEKLMMRSYDL